MFRQDRADTSDGRGRGVLLHFKDDLDVTENERFSRDNITNSVVFRPSYF